MYGLNPLGRISDWETAMLNTLSAAHGWQWRRESTINHDLAVLELVPITMAFALRVGTK